MDHVSQARALRNSIGLALAALLLLAAFSSPAHAAGDAGGTASYKYKVIGFDYKATGAMTGGILHEECSPGVDAVFKGKVSTEPADLTDLRLGAGSLAIRSHGTQGSIEAKLGIESRLSNASHLLDTDCMGQSTESNCTDHKESDLSLNVEISGGVGDRVGLDWSIGQYGELEAGYVPNSFTCVEPLEFPGLSDGSCRSFSSLGRFTDTIFKLTFKCHSQRSTPPVGRDWTTYSGVSDASGSLLIKRTKQTLPHS